MTYRELLKLYKEGKLEEETRREVEKAIEKQDAISAYLFEESDFPQLDEEADALPEKDGGDDTQLLAVIRRSIRKAFIKMGVIVGACVLAAVLCAVLVLPHVVSLFYYNPNEVVGKSEQNEGLLTQRMSLDLSVYSEAFLPGRCRNHVQADAEGYGEYVIRIPQTWTIDGRWETVVGKLTRGKLLLYNENPFRLPTGNAFVLPQDMEGPVMIDHETGNRVGPGGEWEDQYKALEELKENEWYIGYISLKNVTEYEDFDAWLQSLSAEQANLWCAVALEQENGGYYAKNSMGFNCSGMWKSMYWDAQRYPYLAFGEQDPGQWDAAGNTEHFISIVHYLQDHPEVSEMFGGPQVRVPEEDLQRLRENGLHVYGFVVTAKKDTFLQLRDDPRVAYIYAEPWRQ